MGVADKAELPLALLIATSAIATGILASATHWSNAAIAAAVCTALAALEFVNYYKVQLQHFDHAADFRRLLQGRGFRRAHMARDLAAFRRGMR